MTFHPIIGYTLVLRVRYPKSAVDALGGIGVLGEITNKIDIRFNLVGGIEDIKSAKISHRIELIPPAALGTMYTTKISPGYNELTPFPGQGLTVTANHPVTGEPGYHSFTRIWPSTHTVSFPTTLEDGSILTKRRAGSAPGVSSEPYVDTGLSDPFIVSEGSYIDNMDAGYLPVLPGKGTIGDFICYDINRNGIQDPDEPGINGVKATLINQNGNAVAEAITSSTQGG